ncbi:MAG: hypothetical protein ABL953_07490 [Ilumatobacteraceae bacterium]
MAYENQGHPSARWRAYVNQKPIGSLVLCGIIATQLGTYFGYVFPAFGLPVLPWPLYNGILGTTFGDGVNGLVNMDGTFAAAFATSGESFFVGNALHFVNGIVFAILYGILFREDVKFLPQSHGGNIGKGLLYGLIMTIISAGLLVPYAYVPNQGYGLFLFDGPDGWKLPFAILVWHLIYGLFLGMLYQPEKDGKSG